MLSFQHKTTNTIVPILMIVLMIQYSKAQNNTIIKPYELSQKDYKYLSEATNSKDSLLSGIYAQSWLAKAKAEKNWKQMALAYRAIMYKADKNELMKYADSLLFAAKHTTDKGIIGTAYLTKGIMHYKQKEHAKALDNYLLADQYLSQTSDHYAIYKVKYGIANTKYYLGFYEEAISLFKECISYYEEENDLAYLTSLHAIGLCYTKIKKYDLSSYYNKLGLEKSKEYQNLEMIPYFNHSEGINQYFTKNYQTAISSLQKTVPEIHKKKDFANETVAWFYIGKSYWDLKKQKKAIPYFIKVDKAYTDHQYTRPDLRENYELLIDYYTKQQKPELQLKYINRLLEVDSTLNHNYKYLSNKVHKEYDTKKLLVAKEAIEQSLISYRKIGGITIAILVIAIALLYRHHLNKQKRMKQKFDEFIKEQTIKFQPPPQFPQENCDDLNPQLVETILKNLEEFETNHKYIEKDMSLSKLAAHLKTNKRYAYKVILTHRGKKTIEYITDLKINYILNLLKTQNKYRNYTNKALGEEAGFGSTQIFTKAFNKKMGMSPTFFIRELKKSQQEF
ncbi:tetratricopeptide repeat protein [Flavobacterium sp. 102]|uniref:tetratricopeptide repeat protein n=1 Tax=Flavobacterium sp. 102 TaxID=2135623 RepID=UPI000EB064BB|nr:tetratricopeptide repeat protein [Flavobacterium sp. 102]RKS03088.1 tetratricopeptide repeat protein [Flavobacterium sp. 102]